MACLWCLFPVAAKQNSLQSQREKRRPAKNVSKNKKMFRPFSSVSGWYIHFTIKQGIHVIRLEWCACFYFRLFSTLMNVRLRTCLLSVKEVGWRCSFHRRKITSRCNKRSRRVYCRPLFTEEGGEVGTLLSFRIRHRSSIQLDSREELRELMFSVHAMDIKRSSSFQSCG